MNNRQRFKLISGAGLVTMLLGALMVLAPGGAGAANGTFPEDGVHKVDICHRTNSITNPYVLINVDIDAADGSIKGQDHNKHGGDIFDFDAEDPDAQYPKPRNGDQWGDIIPPVPLFDAEGTQIGMTEGLNWPEGQAILQNGCSALGSGPEAPVVIVEKNVPELEVDDDFNFSINDGESFAVGDGETSDEHEVEPSQSVTVAEDLADPGGYELTDVTCTRVSAATPEGADVAVTAVGGEVTFAIANDEIVTCEFTNVPSQTSSAAVSIAKTNDASGDGNYSESEQTSQGADVPFRLVIANTGDVDLTVTSLTDSWGDVVDFDLLDEVSCTTPGDPTPVEFDLADTLAPDVVVTCDFLLEAYAPMTFGGSLTNTATVDTAETAPVGDTSTVTTPGRIIVDSPTYSIEVIKLNDANGNGRFTDDEVAAAEGDAVEFEITIRNTGTGAVTLEALTDSFGGRVVDLLAPTTGLRCPGAGNALVVGTVLAAGSTRVCTFELDDYAPAAGQSIVNTVTVDTDRADDTDTSTVDTVEVQVLPDEEVPPAPVTPPVVVPPVVPPGPPAVPPGPPAVTPAATPQAQPATEVLGDVVTRPQALPRTGSETRGLAGVGALMVALGAAMALGSRRRLAR